MRKPIPFELWKERHLSSLRVILDVISSHLNNSTLPKHMRVDFYFHEDLEDKIMKYIYDHSSSKFEQVVVSSVSCS